MDASSSSEIVANWATAASILFALAVFSLDRRKERRQRELDTVRDLSARYFAYLQLLIAAPHVSTTETEWSLTRAPQVPIEQSLMIQIALSMIETAYFMYEGQRSGFRRAQWAGWYAYLKDWCAHPAFGAMWPDLVEQYDVNFQHLVKAAFAEVHSKKKRVSAKV